MHRSARPPLLLRYLVATMLLVVVYVGRAAPAATPVADIVIGKAHV